jgi:hypothetical protein
MSVCLSTNTNTPYLRLLYLVCDNRVLNKVFGFQWDEVRGNLMILHVEKLDDLSSPNITRPDCDLKLSPLLKRIIPSSGLLREVKWFKTDVSGLPIGPIFKG